MIQASLIRPDPARARSLLFTPLPIGRGRLLTNRIWLPAMVTWRGTEDGHVTEALREIYLRYALGGAGMIVLEATGIRDVSSGPLLRLSADRYVPGLARLVSEMRGVGDCLIVPQIIDFLKIARRQSTRAFMQGMVRRGRLPEAVLQRTDVEFETELAHWLPGSRDRQDFLQGYRQRIEDLDTQEIRRIPGWFAAAARRARDAGFDGVELHFAHAYTLASFLSVTNARKDAYGGSFEGRLRLPLEVVEEVRAAVGPDFLVGCRFLGSEDIQAQDGSIGGNGLAEAQRIAVVLARAGLDFLSVSRGGRFEDAKQPAVGEAMYPYTGYSGSRCIPRAKSDPFGVNAYLAEGVRAAIRAAGFEIPVVASGKIASFEMAEALLQQQRADLVGMARAQLADPDLPRKWLSGADAKQRVCVFCPFCEEEDQRHRVVTCTLWPKGSAGTRSRLTPGTWRPGEPWDPSAPFEAPRDG